MKKAFMVSLLVAASMPAQATDYFLVIPTPGKTVSRADVQVELGVAQLPSVNIGEAYRFDFAPLLKVMGDSKFTGFGVKWMVSGGTLPPGVTLNSSTGLLTGAPSASGNWPFTVSASYMTHAGQQTFQVAVTNLTVTLATAQPPAVAPGTAYSFDFKNLLAVSGDPAYKLSDVTWSAGPGVLPAGLSLNAANGVLSGTSAEFANEGAEVTVTAAYKAKPATQRYTLYPKDPHYDKVTLLAHMDREPFINTKTTSAMTTYGGPLLSTSTKLFGSGAASTTGAGKAIGAPSFRPAADYTIEGWFMPTGGLGTLINIGGISGVSWQSQAVYFGWPIAGKISWVASSGNNGTDIATESKCAQPCSDYITFGTPVINAWNHFAVAYSSSAGQYYLYLNGTRTATLTSNKRPFRSSYQTTIGGYPQNTQAGISGGFPGYLDEFRLTDGVARYTQASFTVSTFAHPDR